jgi:hypothetical protein
VTFGEKAEAGEGASHLGRRRWQQEDPGPRLCLSWSGQPCLVEIEHELVK